MSLTLPRLRPRVRAPGAGRRRAAVIAIACGLVVGLVAASIFTIQQSSREVVGHAASLHSVDETLRAVTVTRSQVAFAAFLASVDERFRTDSSLVIDGTITDARRGIGDARTTIDSAAAGSPLATPQVRELVRAFTARAESIVSLVEAGRPAGARRATERLDTAFEELRGDLVTRRDRALTQIVADDDRLWRVGALASFVAAFIVPCGIVFVYMALTRRSRAGVEAEIARERERAVRERRREGTEAALRDLRGAIMESRRSGAPVPMSVLDDLTGLLAACDGSASRRFEAVPMAALLEDVVDMDGLAGTEVAHRAGDEAAWADRDALRHVVVNLVTEARASGARRVTLQSSLVDDQVQLAVMHDGAPLPREIARVLGGAPADPSPDARRPSTRILAVVAVAESIDAALRSVSEPGPALVLRIASAGSPVSPGRRPVPVPAPAHA
jgi:hypothetical protein